jgi:hypothetical protein
MKQQKKILYLFIANIITLFSFFQMDANAQTINSGAKIQVTEWTYLTVTDFENKNSGTIENLGVIQVRGNWNNNSADSVFSIDKGNVVLIGISNQQINGTTNFYKLEQNGLGGATFQSGNTTISHTLYLTNGTLSSNGKLTLLSNSYRTARIDEITGGAIIGDITMQRYIDAGATNWRFLTSATSGMTISEFTGDFITSGYVGSDFPNWPTPANPWPSIYFYDETTAGINDNGYVAATNTTNTVGVGEGLWIWCGDAIAGTEPFTIDMVGPANNGVINLPVSFTNTGNPDGDGWNMVGNPYASSIDWDSPNIIKNGVDNAIYIWNPDMGQFASYVDGIAINGGSNKIASSQALWVHATSNSAQIQTTEACKTIDDAPFLKQSMSYLTVEVIGVNGRDEAIFNFNPNATNSFDGGYDAFKLASVENRPMICTMVADSLNLSINQMPEQGITIPLKVTTGTSGVHQVNFLDLSNFTNASCILLEDLFTGNRYDLTSTQSFSFNISDTTTTARFLIRFGAETNTTVTDVSCFGNTDGSISIQKNSPLPFDVIWKDNQNNIISNNTSVNVSDSVLGLSSGVYVIETIDSVCGSLIDTVVVTDPLQIMAQYSTLEDTVYLSQGGNIDFTNLSTNATYYDWYFGDSYTSTQTNPSHQYTMVGIYNVELAAFQNANCYQTSIKEITVLDNSTAITDIENNDDIKLWVNNNHLIIKSTDKITRVLVRNTLGQIIIESNKQGTDYSIDLKLISPQLLLITTIKDKKFITHKINYLNQ